LTPKDLERHAFALLKEKLERELPGSTLRDTTNKGRAGQNEDVADAELKYEGRTYHIEIKASSKAVGYNIRFTHQTICNAIGKDLIVALISYLETPNPVFEFFRLSEVADKIGVEPHFYIARKNATGKFGPMAELLASTDQELAFADLLDSPVREHTRLRRSADPLWSPYASRYDDAGRLIPPWLRYPNIPITSAGWRMGDGEEYRQEWDDWLREQSAERLAAYQVKYPAPEDWGDVWPAGRQAQA